MTRSPVEESCPPRSILSLILPFLCGIGLQLWMGLAAAGTSWRRRGARTAEGRAALLTTLLSNRDDVHRERAAIALGRWGDARARDALRRAALADVCVAVRRAALEALSRFRDRGTATVLEETVLGAGDGILRVEAALSLARSARQKRLVAMETQAADPLVRQIVRWARAVLPSPGALPSELADAIRHARACALCQASVASLRMADPVLAQPHLPSTALLRSFVQRQLTPGFFRETARHVSECEACHDVARHLEEIFRTAAARELERTPPMRATDLGHAFLAFARSTASSVDAWIEAQSVRHLNRIACADEASSHSAPDVEELVLAARRAVEIAAGAFLDSLGATAASRRGGTSPAQIRAASGRLVPTSPLRVSCTGLDGSGAVDVELLEEDGPHVADGHLVFRYRCKHADQCRLVLRIGTPRLWGAQPALECGFEHDARTRTPWKWRAAMQWPLTALDAALVKRFGRNSGLSLMPGHYALSLLRYG